MRVIMGCFAFAAAVHVCGCAHMEKVAWANKAKYEKYAAQERSMKTVEMEFSDGIGAASGKVTIEGLKKLTLSIPLNPLDAPELDHGLPGEIKDGAVGVAPWVAGAVIGSKALDAKGDTIHNAAPAEASQ